MPELRVFISSTFRDLQEEREHLVKKIFPEIRAVCRGRGVTFTDIDLRWGLTEEEAILGRVIRTCLEEIDKCRPYFIGILGNRYGWAPEYHELMMDPELIGRYPWIEEIAFDGPSITEIEFIHGAFGDNREQLDRQDGCAFFYHRTGAAYDDDDDDDAAKLSSLIERARGTGRPFREFADADELGEYVRNDLLALIDQHWPTSEAPDELERERRAHAAFSGSRLRAYIANPTHINDFSRWLREGTTPLVVGGTSGLGKSSLVAYLVDSFRKKNPTALVIEHFVGASPTSGAAASLMRHVILQIQEQFGLDEDLPAREDELERSFPNWLFRCEHLAAREGIAVMIALDAVNQLSESGRRLTWLPKTIPAGLKLIVSTTPGEADDRLIEREWERLTLEPIGDERIRQSIVIRYLGEFHKSISAEQVKRITSDAKGSSPLFLRVVADELRLHGEHESLDAAIARYCEASDVLDVFGIVLERIERDYGEPDVRALMSVIWASRGGLSERELMDLAGINRLDLSRLLFAIDYHFVQREGALGFFHDYLQRAVEQRYLSAGAGFVRTRRKIAQYFESVEITSRTALELVWQYGSECDGVEWPEKDARLAAILARDDVIVALRNVGGQFEMLERWADLSTKGFRPAEEFLRELSDEYEAPGTLRLAALGIQAWMLTSIGESDAAGKLYALLASLGKTHGQRDAEAKGLKGLGEIQSLQGQLAEAMESYRKAFAIASDIYDRQLMAEVLGNIGFIHITQGRFADASTTLEQMYDICEASGDGHGLAAALGYLGMVRGYQGGYSQALEYYRRQRELAVDLGNRLAMGSAIGNMGIVYFHQGKYEDALECYRQQISTQEGLGNRHGLASATCNIGLVYDRLGRFSEALECYQRAMTIMEEIGDRHGLAVAIGNVASMHVNQRSISEAIECYENQRSIYEEVGDPRGRSIAIGNMGWSFELIGDYGRALECFVEARDEHRRVGFPHGLTYWLDGTARVFVALVSNASMPDPLSKQLPEATSENWRSLALKRARELEEECLAISNEIGKPDTQHSARITIARIDAGEGSPAIALANLGSMLEATSNVEQQADLHYWMWRIAREGALAADDVEVHRNEALRLFREIHVQIPSYRYERRIEELRAAINPQEMINAPE